MSEGGGTRTHDLGIKSPLLYQLSYAPHSKHPHVKVATQGHLPLAAAGTRPHHRCMPGTSRRFTLATAVLVALGCESDPAGLRALPGISIIVTPSHLTITVGATAALDATVRDLEGRPLPERKVQWSSNAPDIVEVSAQGVVTGRSAGVAQVGAYSDQQVGFARVVVQMDFRLPVTAGYWSLRAETGSPTALCPGGEGGRRVDGGRECSHAGISRYSLDFMATKEVGPSAGLVAAAAVGTVSDVCLQPPQETTCGPNGPFVYIEHGSGFATFYSHLDPASVTVRRKTSVEHGALLGRMGSWDAEGYPWVHFELRYGNQDVGDNPVLDELLIEGRRLAEYRLEQ